MFSSLSSDVSHFLGEEEVSSVGADNMCGKRKLIQTTAAYQGSKNPHALEINSILVDPLPGDEQEADDSPISLVLSLLLTDDEYDLELRTWSVRDLVTRFFEEFDSVAVQSFAMDCLVGYIECRRLSTRVKMVAAFALLMGVTYRSPELIKRKEVSLDTVMYTSLKYGSPCPVRCAENSMFSEGELYLLSRLFLTNPESTMWSEKLDNVVRRWEQEVEALATSNVSVKQVIIKDVANLLRSLEKRLIECLVTGDHYTCADIREALLENVDKLAIQRQFVRQEILAARGDLVVGNCMKELLPEWKKYEHYLEDPLKNYLDEFLENVPYPEPNCSSKEMMWIIPSKDKDKKETDDMANNLKGAGELSEIQLLMMQCFRETINIHQRKQLIDEIRGNSQMNQYPGLAPETLHELIELNPTVAIEILLKLLINKSRMNEYFDAMVKMEMSVHSMEVVNRLTSSVNLPREFLYLYISNCIKTCETIDDKYVQNRLVRLLCVFVQSLIRNQIIDIQDIYVEVIVFLLAFSRIREAAALFRLIRHVESEDPELREIIAKKLESNEHLSDPLAKPLPMKEKDRKS